MDIAIVEAGEGMSGMFVLGDDTSFLYYTIRRNNGGSSSQWQYEKINLIGVQVHGHVFSGEALVPQYFWKPIHRRRRFHAGCQDTTA